VLPSLWRQLASPSKSFFFLPSFSFLIYANVFCDSFGILRLTDDGLIEVKQCNEKGHHAHYDGMYEVARHIELRRDQRKEYTVVDFRKP